MDKDSVGLEQAFLRLVREIDPNADDHPPLAAEFAKRLAVLADTWATNPEDVDAYETSLSQWIEAAMSFSSSDSQFRNTATANSNPAAALLWQGEILQQALQAQAMLVQASIESASAYIQLTNEVSKTMHLQVANLIQEQTALMNCVFAESWRSIADRMTGSDATVEAVKSAMAAADNAYDSISKAAQQISEMNERSLRNDAPALHISKQKSG